MNLIDTLNRFGELLGEPPVKAPEYVDGYVFRLSANTIAEYERVIRENPQMARDMGVEIES